MENSTHIIETTDEKEIQEWLPSSQYTVSGFCHDQIGSTFFEIAKLQADIAFISTINTGSGLNVRGFALVNTMNYEEDEVEPSDTWYINLVCMAKAYQGPALRSRLGIVKSPTGQDLINHILYKAAEAGKRVSLNAIDTVIGYYGLNFKFELATKRNETIISANEKLNDLAGIQKMLNNHENEKDTLDSRTLELLEERKSKILSSGSFKSATQNYFRKLDKEGHEAVENAGYTEGWYMISPELDTEFIKDIVRRKELEYSEVPYIDKIFPGSKQKNKKTIKRRRKRNRKRTTKRVYRRPKKGSKKRNKSRRPKRRTNRK